MVTAVRLLVAAAVVASAVLLVVLVVVSLFTGSFPGGTAPMLDRRCRSSGLRQGPRTSET